MYRKEQIAAQDMAADPTRKTAERNRAIQKASFFQRMAAGTDEIRPTFADTVFANVNEIRQARMVGLYLRDSDVQRAFWRNITKDIEVFASFFGHATTVADVR